MTLKVEITVLQEGDVARAVLNSGQILKRLNVSAFITCKVKTAVSELARNIYKYAGSGTIVIKEINNCGRTGVQIIAIDHGPGIHDLNEVMNDHFSTGKSLGLGLPGVKRLMDDFEISSTPNQQTMVKAIKWL